MVFQSYVGDGWHGCGLKLLCSEKTKAPLFKALSCCFLAEKSANTDRPSIGFCIELLLGSKYAGELMGSCQKTQFPKTLKAKSKNQPFQGIWNN